MQDLSVGKVGLTFHLDKQKNRGNDRQYHAMLELLPVSECAEHLGQTITF